jgi:hypothetical protein
LLVFWCLVLCLVFGVGKLLQPWLKLLIYDLWVVYDLFMQIEFKFNLVVVSEWFPPLFMLFLHFYIWIYMHICKLCMILSYDMYYNHILQFLFSSQSLAGSQFWLPCTAFIFVYMW